MPSCICMVAKQASGTDEAVSKVRANKGLLNFRLGVLSAAVMFAMVAVTTGCSGTVLPIVEPTLSPDTRATPSASGARSPAQPTNRRRTETPSERSTASTRATVTVDELRVSFAELESRLPTRSIGMALSGVGTEHVVTLGSWREGPAWSTIKVPLSLAALEESQTSATRKAVHQAITESDNAAAEQLWSDLGSGHSAANAVDQVLESHGDLKTQTQSEQVRPPFTAVGQTTWSLIGQGVFMRTFACAPNDDPQVKVDMMHISESQSWGLGRIGGSQFKGGWGPDESGRYLVRQMGLVSFHGSEVAVAVAVEPRNGSFEQGTLILDEVATWLMEAGRSGRLPHGSGCQTARKK